MEGNEDSSQEGLVFFLEGESETVDDGTKDLKKFSDTVMTFSFVNELEEDVVYRSSDKCSQVEEFSVDSVESGLEEITLSWIFGIEQVKQLHRRYTCQS